MKKNILFSIVSFLSLNVFFAQLPVSHNPENKNVVLEEFTGINCPWCPAGHKIAQEIQNDYPEDVFVVNIHTGGYANPGGGQPDFRTSFGPALANQSGLQGYPSGTVNRHVFSGTHTAMSRGAWRGATNAILAESSYCNVAAEASIDMNTRQVTVNVEVYYTANGATSNSLNVVLLQDNIEGPQAGKQRNPAQVLPNGNYNHTHMLRHMLTGQWGDVINTTSQGDLVQRQYTYTLPANINGVPVELGNLEILVFVSEGHQEIITGNYALISYPGLPYNDNVVVQSSEQFNEICSSNQFKPKLKLKNYGVHPITSMTITYDMNGADVQTYNWTGVFQSLAEKIITLPSFSFPVLNTNTFHLSIDSVNGVADDHPEDNSLSVSGIVKTSNEGDASECVVTLVQDRYGSQTMWIIFDDNDDFITGAGTFSDLPNNGTQIHTTTVNLPEGCYKFLILDSGGDGINNGHGAGSYKIEDATGHIILEGDGHFTDQEIKVFNMNPSAGVDDALSSRIKIYPNPSAGDFIFENVCGMSLEIFNMMGIRIYEENNLPLSKNIHLEQFSEGAYFVRLKKGRKVMLKKIIITK